MGYDYQLPAVQNPDMYGAFLRGQLGSQQLQANQQGLQEGQQKLQEGTLNMQQLRMAMQMQQQRAALANSLYGQGQGVLAPQQGTQAAGAQAVAAPTGGVQQGPQGMPQQGQQDQQPPQSALDAWIGARGSVRDNTSMIDRNTQMAQFDAVNAGKDPNVAYKNGQEARKAELEDQANRTKIALSPFADRIQTVLTAQNPGAVVNNNENFRKLWAQEAPKLGIDPNDPLQMTPENVKQAFGSVHNEIAAKSMGTIAPIDISGANGKGNSPADIQGYNLSKQEGFDGTFLDWLKATKPGLSENGVFNPKEGALLAAFAEKSVSLPAGFRSKEQQKATLEGIIARHPDMSPDAIADGVKSGKINLEAEMNKVRVAGKQAGKVELANNELEPAIQAVRDSMKAMPNGAFVPWNKLRNYTATQLGDPNVKALRARINFLMNAYDQMASRGGTDVAKRAEQHQMVMDADSPKAMEAALQSLELESRIARGAAEKSMHSGGNGFNAPSGGSAPAKGGVPSDIQSLLDKHGTK
jgi:hypothetical protein